MTGATEPVAGEGTARWDDWDVTVRGDGPGVVLAHGAGGGIEANFGLVLDDLARDHRVVGPHYPGAGRTPVVERLELDDLADAVVTAGQRVGLAGAVLLGESLGCAVAVRAATRHPDFVTGLVLTVGFPVADPLLGQAAEIVAALTGAAEGGDPRARRTLARFLTTSCLTDVVLSEITPSELDRLVDGTVRYGPVGTAAHFDLVSRVDVRADLDLIDVPTLVVVATGDRLVLPASHRRLATGIRSSRVVELPGGAHILTPEDRRLWWAEVQEFLRSLNPSGAGW